MVVARRLKKTEKKKTFPFIAFVIPLFLLLVLFLLVYFVDPATIGVIPFFLFLVFLLVYFTLRRLSFAIAIISFLILQYFHIGNIVNLLLIAAIAIAYEFYTRKSN